MLQADYANAKILLIDDEPANTELFDTILRHAGYGNLRSVNDARGVLCHYIEFNPDLIVLDLMMPFVDGFQILEFVQRTVDSHTTLPVLVVTADDRFESRRRALAEGAIDFLIKPFIPDELRLRVRNLLTIRLQQLELLKKSQTLEMQVFERTRELESFQLELKEAQIEIVVRLARAGEHHDDETGQHTQRVGLTCSLLARAMQLTEAKVELIGRSAPLHDVGKIGIPDSILLKPGRLTEAERLLMQRHCNIGADLLSGGQSDLVKMAESIALNHHERWDGTGYPRALRGDDIPIEGRILAVADVFDALTHQRPYKAAWPVQDAIEEIRNHSGGHFDPAVVEAFMGLPHDDLL